MTRDYVISFIAEGIAVALSLFVYRVAATTWAPATFAEYALSRKILSVVLVIALFGMDTAVVRFVAFEGRGRTAAAAGYLRAALMIGGGASALLIAIFVTLGGPLAQALYGEDGHASVLAILGIASLGGSLYGIAYGYERAFLRIGHAAVLLVLVTGLVPLVGVAGAPASAGPALLVMGVGWIVVGGGAVALRLHSGAAVPIQPLFAYGASRSLGLLLQMGLLTAPAVVAAHRFGIVESGNVAFALLVLGLLSTLLTPIGVVLMPRSLHLALERDAVTLRRHVTALVVVIVPAVAGMVIVVQLVADPLVAAYLGPSYAGAAPALRAFVWAAIPWSVFVALRGLIDASDVRPLNARNVLIACTVYAVLLASAGVWRLDQAAYSAAFVISVAVLGALTLVEGRRALSRPLLPEAVVEDALQP